MEYVFRHVASSFSRFDMKTFEKFVESIFCVSLAFFGTAYLASTAPPDGCPYFPAQEIAVYKAIVYILLCLVWGFCIHVLEEIWRKGFSFIFQ